MNNSHQSLCLFSFPFSHTSNPHIDYHRQLEIDVDLFSSMEEVTDRKSPDFIFCVRNTYSVHSTGHYICSFFQFVNMLRKSMTGEAVVLFVCLFVCYFL